MEPIPPSTSIAVGVKAPFTPFGKDARITTRIAEITMNEIDLDGMRSGGGIVHDINNNLATIIGTVDLLLSHVDSQSEISDGLKDVLAAALKMQELVRTIPRRQLG
jgi:hypothetical protein